MPVHSSYHDLWHVEQSFRMSKTDLQARPMFHHQRDAIEAHLTIVFTALAIARYMQNATGLSLKKIIQTLRPIQSALLAAGDETQLIPAHIPDDIAAQRQQWRDRAAACKAICEQFPQWSQIDTETADGHAEWLREQYELLLADNPDIEALNARADECWSQIQKLMTRRGAVQTRPAFLGQSGEVPGHLRPVLDPAR